MMNETKPLVASKTFWLNALTLIAVFLNRETQVLDAATVDAVALSLATLGNIALRIVNSSRIKGVVS